MISLIIATWNGAPTLARTLEAMTLLEVPDDGYEIIVVDNASTDETPAIIDRFKDRLPLTHLHEARRGKAHALNTAIEAAKGDFLVFTDDDVIPDQGFLRAYEAVADAHPEHTFFTGHIRLHWAAQPPDWLKGLGEAGMAYASTHVDLKEGSVLWLRAKGPNMAVRRNAIENVRFRTDDAINYLGPGTGTGGEDCLFASDVVQGKDIWFSPSACVQHMVRPHQIGVRPVFARYYRIGMSSYFLHPGIEAVYARTVLGLPFPLMKNIVKSFVGGLYRFVIGEKEAAARRMMTFASDLGVWKSWRDERGK